MKCDKCKWADWNKTKNGRLHPDKQGKCTYQVIVPELPYAFCWSYDGSKKITPIWGQIERGRELKQNCIYYEESK
jgi:hypothetical protein